MFLLVNHKTNPQLALAIGLAMMAAALYFMATADCIQFRHLTPVEATVLEAHGKRLDVSYIDETGQEQRVAAYFSNRDNRIFAPPAAGETVIIRYNPDDPEEVVVSFTMTRQIIALSLLSILFCYGLAHMIQGLRY